MFITQDLTITVTTERPDTEVDLIPDHNEMSAINKQTFVDQQVNVGLARGYYSKLCKLLPSKLFLLMQKLKNLSLTLRAG